MKIANDAERRHLLSIIDKDGVLSSHSIDHSIWQGESRSW